MERDPLEGAVWMTDDGPRHFADMSTDELKDVIRRLLEDNTEAHRNFRQFASLRERF